MVEKTAESLVNKLSPPNEGQNIIKSIWSKHKGKIIVAHLFLDMISGAALVFPNYVLHNSTYIKDGETVVEEPHIFHGYTEIRKTNATNIVTITEKSLLDLPLDHREHNSYSGSILTKNVYSIKEVQYGLIGEPTIKIFYREMNPHSAKFEEADKLFKEKLSKLPLE